MVSLEVDVCLANAQNELDAAKKEVCSIAENRLIDSMDELIQAVKVLLREARRG